MRIQYDPDADVLSASRGAIKNIDHAEEMGDIILHVNRKNEPILVEVLNASKIFLRPILGGIKSGKMKSQTRRASAKFPRPVAV